LLVTGLVLTLVGVSLLFFLLRNPFAERQIYRQLDFIATLVATRDGGGLISARPERLTAALAALPQFQAIDARAIVLNTRGEVLADSRGDLEVPPEASLQAATAAAVQGDFRLSSGRWLYVSRPFDRARVLMLSAPQASLSTVRGLAQEFLPPLLQTCLVGLAVSLGLAWLTARWVAGPLRRVAEAAGAVAGGDYSTRLAPEGPNEVRTLAGTFNQMVERVQSINQAQRDFVSNVSHELKTPLTSIQGFAQAILEGAIPDPEGLRRAARVIHEESDRLRRLVADLLDLARLDAQEVPFVRAPVDLNGLLNSVVERISLRAAERGVRLENGLPPFPVVIGDGDRLAQVFTNLLDNAVKFAPAGSPIRLEGEVSGGWAAVHVDDKGPGIPAEELSRIFERFYQLDKARRAGAGRGVGLGLAISREIVQAHGGRLTASSRPGNGSRFSVLLPISKPRDPTLIGRKRPRIG
jgi:signal transduction histidine kinase